jgi:SAM-dependent methyltransferase
VRKHKPLGCLVWLSHQQSLLNKKKVIGRLQPGYLNLSFLMNYKEKFYPESRFGGFSDIDGTITFYGRINALIQKSATVLDIGCGRGAWVADKNQFRRELRLIKGKVNQVIGIDVDPASAVNPCIDQYFQLNNDYPWPLTDKSIDLAFSDQVLEHVSDPDLFFSESQRVLKQDGYLCIRTTNNWGYIAIGAKVIPNRLHGKIIKEFQINRKEEDVFPTVFRCNSIVPIKRMLKKYDFDGVVYGYDSEPAYFDNSYLGYLIAKAYHYVCPSILKSTLFIFAKKCN